MLCCTESVFDEKEFDFISMHIQCAHVSMGRITIHASKKLSRYTEISDLINMILSTCIRTLVPHHIVSQAQTQSIKVEKGRKRRK